MIATSTMTMQASGASRRSGARDVAALVVGADPVGGARRQQARGEVADIGRMRRQERAKAATKQQQKDNAEADDGQLFAVKRRQVR
jgi:hypothetical protein